MMAGAATEPDVSALLTAGDGAPVALENADAGSRILLVCEHASSRLPERMGTLGLSPDALESHIAWDPGALAVCRLLSASLDATLIYQRFSRLVYDCNRPPDSPGAMPAVSEVFDIPGNAALSAAERLARTEAIYSPFRKGLSDLIKTRVANRRPPVIVTIHSFTPVWHGRPREVEVGILHDSDSRLADAFLADAAEDEAFVTRRNAPYGPQDGVTHTLIEHGIHNGLLNVMIEIRNDLIANTDGQRVLAGYIGDHLGKALMRLEP
ncbi:N-formylglutamate amidohydrolase [Rhizobium sp. DKSPLA3]|uniref:N-formylglutamate amidohydrolase n=1 Tax=Rhizobium quercicola TaxID=2901226 RepID=A0A9X1NUJ0_9HYPH|nr:N-formylglutamate amidohydrolase [Rhizobium quercicola]MCD7110723.1 N-formylglutamate amidohydrolase [Rhizobium quercicola]